MKCSIYLPYFAEETRFTFEGFFLFSNEIFDGVSLNMFVAILVWIYDEER
jgi:hypothetical protein